MEFPDPINDGQRFFFNLGVVSLAFVQRMGGEGYGSLGAIWRTVGDHGSYPIG